MDFLISFRVRPFRILKEISREMTLYIHSQSGSLQTTSSIITSKYHIFCSRPRQITKLSSHLSMLIQRVEQEARRYTKHVIFTRLLLLDLTAFCPRFHVRGS